MSESVFDEIKYSIIESIRFSKTLPDLKKRVENILQEYDFREEEER